MEKARDQRLNEYVLNCKGADVIDAIEKGEKLIRGSTLKSFNRKVTLKAARYRDPTSIMASDENLDEEETDEIPQMDFNLDLDAE